MLVTVLGLLAAALTSLSYVPQVRKAWPLGATGDLSLGMLAVLGAGLSLWVGSGWFRSDYVVVVANTVGLGLVLALIALKLRDSFIAPSKAMHG